MKQTEYNIKTRQCKTNYSPDPWGELKEINDRAIIDNMIRDYTYINKKPPALRQQGQAKQNFKHVNDSMK